MYSGSFSLNLGYVLEVFESISGGFGEVLGGQIKDNYPQQIKNPLRYYNIRFNVTFNSLFNE